MANSENAVVNMTKVAFEIVLANSIPLTPGICMSKKTSSTSLFSKKAVAASAPLKVPIDSKLSVWSINFWIAFLAKGSSSTIMQFMIIILKLG
ncbi:hypothetical protein D3C80_1797030 [compost metagenome]